MGPATARLSTQEQPSSHPRDPSHRLRQTSLANGLTVVVRERPDTSTVAVQVWVRAGSRHELSSENGVAHLLEHLLFKDSPGSGEEDFQRRIFALGGVLNAETFWEHTRFYTVTLAADLEQAIHILAGIVLRPEFDLATVEREKQVVLEEMAAVQDDPRRYALEVVARTVFPGHPLGRPILGTGESVKRLALAQVLAFYHRFYRPRNMVVVVVGGVRGDRALRLVEETFRFAAVPDDALLPAASPPGQAGFRRVEIERLLLQPYIAVGVRTGGIGAPEHYPMQLIDAMLASGIHSRLQQRLKEQEGLADVVESLYLPLSDLGIWGVYAGVAGGGTVERAQQVMLAEIERLRNNPITAEELRLAKQVAAGRFLLSIDTNDALATFYGRMASLAHLESDQDYLRRLEEVTLPEVQRLVGELFRPERLNMFVLKPLAGVRKFFALLRYLFKDDRVPARVTH